MQRDSLVLISLAVLFTACVFLSAFPSSPQTQSTQFSFQSLSPFPTPVPRPTTPINPLVATLPLPAIDASGKGEVTWLTVERVPGSGRVLFSMSPDLQFDPEVQASAVTAVSAARSYAGTPSPESTDIRVSFQAPAGTSVAGGSGGASISLATLSVLTATPLRKDTAVTGTISPDGSIGRVGGVLEKARAVAAAGFTRFLVPVGEGTALTSVSECRDVMAGNTLVHQCIPRAVSVDVGSAIGLQVIEVNSLSEAWSLLHA